jgi:hypothetical protein
MATGRSRATLDRGARSIVIHAKCREKGWQSDTGRLNWQDYGSRDYRLSDLKLQGLERCKAERHAQHCGQKRP